VAARGDPVKVRDHDFPDEKLGKITPYGIYDITANRGFVSVGTSHDTAAFAVSALRLWWQAEGSLRYPGASRLLVTCDAGAPTATSAGCGKTSSPSWPPGPGEDQRRALPARAHRSGTGSSTGCSATSPAPGAPVP